MRPSSRTLAALVALATALTVAACGRDEITAPSGGAQQSGAASQSGAPNLDTDRLDEVLASVQETLDHADQSMDATDLGARVADPALSLRRAQYALASAKGAEVAPLTLTAQSVTVTNMDTWPRAIVDIAQADAGALPNVFVLTQQDARSDYKLVNWTRLLGGTSLTTIAVDQGSPYVGADATGFVMTPADAVAAYVDMLNAGTAGDDHFTTDEFAKTYLDGATSLNDSVKAAGSVTVQAETPAADAAPPAGVVLQDGSALVAASFTYSSTYARTVKDSTIKLGGAAATLAGDDPNVVGTVTAHYVATVLLQIPSAQAGGKASVVGAERSIVSITRDDSKKPEGE